MGTPYSNDLRERIVGAVDDGSSRREAARLYGVSASCAVKLVRRLRETGSLLLPMTGTPPTANDQSQLISTEPSVPKSAIT